MKTIRLYTQDVYMKAAEATVVNITEQDGRKFIILDRTVFFPTGGGQSCDTGFIGDCRVISVFEEDDEIYHEIDESANIPALNEKVSMSIDWERRFDNMQRHCGEHILSGSFYRLFGGTNKGFHMGEDYMTIDIKLEDNTQYDKISREMAKAAELDANKVIWADLPVRVFYFDERDEAEKMKLRKALAFDEDISIVNIGSTDEPADCVACCGTHPSSTGQVGLIKIYKVEVNKDMFRIFFEAGQRAFEQYQARYDVLSHIEKKLSAGFDDVIRKYEVQLEKQQSVRDQLYHIKKEVIHKETADILAELKDESLTRSYSVLSVDDLLAIAKGLVGSVPRMVYLVHEPSNTVILVSNGKAPFECGKLVKDNASIYNGKGGGRAETARAIFPKHEYVEVYIDLLEKHLR